MNNTPQKRQCKGGQTMSDELDRSIADAIRRLAEALKERGWLLTTAESCTGGWIAKCCTDPPGSSNWFDRGYVAYSYPAKQEELGVIREDLEAHGAVSEAIAAQMALGARRRSGADLTLAATGIAGPTGGLPNKPVGMVCFAWSMRGAILRSECVTFEGDRESIRKQTVLHAVEGALLTLEQE